MGVILDLGIDELYDHEGYVAHILDDGTSAHGTWTAEIERHTVAWRAECTCGWHGPEHPLEGHDILDDDRSDAILLDWEHVHMAIVQRAVEVIHRLQAVETANEKLQAALRDAAANGISTDQLAGTLRITATEFHRRYPQLAVTDQPATPPNPPVETGGYTGYLTGRPGEGQRWLQRDDRPSHHTADRNCHQCSAQVADPARSPQPETPSL